MFKLKLKEETGDPKHSEHSEPTGSLPPIRSRPLPTSRPTEPDPDRGFWVFWEPVSEVWPSTISTTRESKGISLGGLSRLFVLAPFRQHRP